MTPWVKRLVFANVGMFLLTMGAPDLQRLLLLVPALIPQRPWTPITYMFLHAGLWHIAFNMIALFFFGPRLEARLGGTPFLVLYLVSGLMGALLSLPFTPYAPIVGASGAVFGVLLGFARYWPRERIYIWGIVGIEARLLVIITAVVSLVLGIQGGGRVAHFAHLGGFLGGYLFLKWRERTSGARKFKARATGNDGRRKRPGRKDVERWSRIPRDDMHPVNRAELDRVLSKLEENGVQSLTEDERAFLDRFSRG